MTSKLDPKTLTPRVGSSYPAPHHAPCAARENRALGNAFELTQFGVVLTRLPPGAWSSQRHWHEVEDEFAYVLEGEAALVTDAGEQVVRAGECVGFKAGTRDGHHFINRSDKDVVLLVVGGRSNDDWGEYSDIDMKFHPGRYAGKGGYARKNGEPL